MKPRYTTSGTSLVRLDRRLSGLRRRGEPAGATAARREFSESQLALVERHLQKIRAMADWIETAVSTGKVDLDEALAELLRGQ
jgi:hypothetical protein